MMNLQLTRNHTTWRNLVLERDDYQCQECRLPHRSYFSIPIKLRPTLEAHHIIGIKIAPDLIFDLENGETLCFLCHKFKHTKKGKNNGER